MDWQGRKVLITGAAGFIGSHLCERLLLAGADVRAMVHGNMRGSIGHLAAIPEDLRKGLEIVGGNIRDGAFVRDATIGMDTVFHLAAITSVVYSYSNPDETVITNVSGTLNVCNAARHENVRRLVHTSSAGVYGTTAGDTPISETHPVRAYNPYTASKLAADNVVESFHLSYELPVTIVRIFNVYGPRIGRFLIIPTIILQLLKGSELKLGSLTPTRNFTYVDDIAAGTLLALKNVGYEIFNLGGHEVMSINAVIELLENLLGKKANRVYMPTHPADVFSNVADVGKARQMLGWEPCVGLHEGVQNLVDWYLANRSWAKDIITD